MLDRTGVGPRFRAQLPLALKEGILSIPAATTASAGSISAADQAALSAARTAGIVVQTQRSQMFGLVGDTLYVNATTAWVAVGAQFKAGPGYGLLAKPTGATRRWRLEIIYQQDIANPSSSNLWLLTGGAPGVGTVQLAVNDLPQTTAPAATYRALYVTANTVGDPYNSADATWYCQAGTLGTTRIWSITCVVEDYIA